MLTLTDSEDHTRVLDERRVPASVRFMPEIEDCLLYTSLAGVLGQGDLAGVQSGAALHAGTDIGSGGVKIGRAHV